MISQERFERLSELMANKGVVHEAFEILADIRQSEKDNYENLQTLRFNIVKTLREGNCKDYEGFNASNLNFIKCIRKLIEKGGSDEN